MSEQLQSFGLNPLDENTCSRGMPIRKLFSAEEARLVKRFINSFRVRMWEGNYPFVDRSDPLGEYVIYLPRALGEQVAFEVISVGDDKLTCTTVKEVDKETGLPIAASQGDDTVDVYKPWLLRKTPFHDQEVNGVSYTYTSATERTATEVVEEGTPEEESQSITPDYLVRTVDRSGELIYAVKTLEGWVDTNHAGRCWAAIEDEEEEEEEEVV